MPVETPLIEFRDVTKRFGDQTVLDQINLKIYKNQITTIMGKSGAGKSVLLKHFIGLLSPDAGTILFLGKPLDKMRRGEWDRYGADQLSLSKQRSFRFHDRL
jgi:phospholipid/cholesterol/gamma-HCH transport system ATP-binding protein